MPQAILALKLHRRMFLKKLNDEWVSHSNVMKKELETVNLFCTFAHGKHIQRRELPNH